MFDEMDLDAPSGPPGGENFEDITDLFVGAANDMASEELLFGDGFTLMDAMSAFEIGEPRMDSGMTLEEDVWSKFDPLTPILPEELCWMLDRTFACEMEWHAGNTLSQSVFTFLYIHQLADINPDLLPPAYPPHRDPRRPFELITLALRAGVFGLLKSCDFVWRELAKKRVCDIEDWQSDKCDVTLLEGVPVEVVLKKLEDACIWLRHSSLPAEASDALCDRLLLRKTLLQLFRLNTAEELDELRPLLTIARSLLRRVQNTPSPTPSKDSPALASFDPRVTRRLHTVVPIRVLELPSQELVWQSLDRLLEEWHHLSHLREIHSLWAWKVAGSLNVWGPERRLRSSYIRSLTQGVFCDRNIVLGDYPTAWIIDQFFQGTLGLPYHVIVGSTPDNWVGRGRWTAKDVETHIIRVTVNYIKTFWYNPPRRRRALMRSMVDWQLLHEALLTMEGQVIVQDHMSAIIAFALPKAAVVWKLTVIREIILSGFQIELYAPNERSVAYWYLAHVAEQHLDCLETLRSLMPADSPYYHEMEIQSHFLTGLQLMSISMSAITAKDLTQSMDRMSLNFLKRHKWLPTDDAGSLLMSLPSFSQFPSDLRTVFDDMLFSPQENLMLAKGVLTGTLNIHSPALCDPHQIDERRRFFMDLANVAGDLAVSLNGATKSARLEWDPAYHPWFPRFKL